MPLLDAGHYIAQYRSYEGEKLSRPKKWADSLERIKQEIKAKKAENNGE